MLTEKMIKEEIGLEFQILKEKIILNYDEIKTKKEKYYYRHLFHKKIISRVFHRLSSNRIRIAVHHIINILGFKPEISYNIIDVSCGYDDLLIELAERFKKSYIVGNDLAWKKLLSLPKKRRLHNITLTTHDILSSEFCQKDKYDLIICKNTLHHIIRTKQLYLLENLLRAGSVIIFIEIENPLKSSFSSFIWNFYYRKFLKDDGLNFIDHDGFYNLLSKIKIKMPTLEIFHGSLKTIKGYYLLAIFKNFKKAPKNAINLKEE